MRIIIQTIPHKKQRYDTCGDWAFGKNEDLFVTVSHMGNVYYELLVGIHEVIEAFLCRHANIEEKKVTAFDMQYEKERKKGKHSRYSEPGDDRRAPYYNQHQLATAIEMVLAAELDVDWIDYEEAVESL